MQAAARFPELVAQRPQRTYAIITKYDTLRSFVKLKPEGFTPLQYEVAQIGIKAMMDAFMTYKSLYAKLVADLFDVKAKTREIKAWTTDELKLVSADGTKETAIGTGLFAATVKGLEDAQKAIRRQMAFIVNEVAEIEKAPKRATDDTTPEVYQSPGTFQSRIPVVGIREEAKRDSETPLGGKSIAPPTDPTTAAPGAPKAAGQTQPGQKVDGQKGDSSKPGASKPATPTKPAEEEEVEENPPIIDPSLILDDKMKALFTEIGKERPDAGVHIKVSQYVGRDETQGYIFNDMAYVQESWAITSISIQIVSGAVKCIIVTYPSGLKITRGFPEMSAGAWYTLDSFKDGERIISASIETGVPVGSSSKRVLSLCVYTNRGRSAAGRAGSIESSTPGSGKYDGVEYTKTEIQHFDCPTKGGSLIGFYGYQTTNLEGIGCLWTVKANTTFSVPANVWADNDYQSAQQMPNLTLPSTFITDEVQIYWIEALNRPWTIPASATERVYTESVASSNEKLRSATMGTKLTTRILNNAGGNVSAWTSAPGSDMGLSYNLEMLLLYRYRRQGPLRVSVSKLTDDGKYTFNSFDSMPPKVLRLV